MNVTKAKEIATSHINIATHITQSQKSLDYLQVYKMEGACIMGETKDIPNGLLPKMAKQYNKMKILRVMALLSTSSGGVDQKTFDFLRRTFISTYGYQEIVTMMNM